MPENPKLPTPTTASPASKQGVADASAAGMDRAFFVALTSWPLSVRRSGFGGSARVFAAPSKAATPAKPAAGSRWPR